MTKHHNLHITRFPLAYHSTSPAAKSRGVSIVSLRAASWSLRDLLMDDQGHYLFLKGELEGELVTLYHLYPPNVKKISCVEHCLEALSSFSEGVLIVGGDFNVAPDLLLDVSSRTSHHSYAFLRHFKMILQVEQLVDIWHILNSLERDYFYFSPVHNSYSRIDF